MKTYIFKIDRYEFIVNTKEDEDNKNIFNCHIPAYDILFMAKDEEMIERKAKIMVGMWFKHFEIK